MPTNPAAVEAAFTALLAAHLAKDQTMNRESCYAPTAGVLAQRELHRQADAVRKIGESIRADFWQEWAGRARLQVGFRDNRDRASYENAVEALRAPLAAVGLKLTLHANMIQFVSLDGKLAREVQKRHTDWLARLAA